MKTLSVAFALLATLSITHAQSPIAGVDLRGTDMMFTSNTSGFVANFVETGPVTGVGSVYALDFDATATTLWGIDNDTADYGTFDIGTGVFTSLGIATLPLDYTNGLTAHPDGVTWYAVGRNPAGDSELWVGDVATGQFTLVGVIVAANIIIDIACDNQGLLYGHSISDDGLYSIDTATGAGTFIGSHGLAANFAQGIDFDWSDNSLYAAIYTGGGTGQFCTLDVNTGAILTSEDTTPINAEMEIAVQQPSAGPIGTTFGCPMTVPNSSGNPAVLAATGSVITASNSVTLTTTGMPTNQFGYYLNSLNQNQVGFTPPGSQGNLCIGPAGLGRYNASVLNSGTAGEFSLDLDLANTPTPAGNVAIAAGETWYFTTWFRDNNPNPTSNFSDAVCITFQ